MARSRPWGRLGFVGQVVPRRAVLDPLAHAPVPELLAPDRLQLHRNRSSARPSPSASATFDLVVEIGPPEQRRGAPPRCPRRRSVRPGSAFIEPPFRRRPRSRRRSPGLAVGKWTKSMRPSPFQVEHLERAGGVHGRCCSPARPGRRGRRPGLTTPPTPLWTQEDHVVASAAPRRCPRRPRRAGWDPDR